MRVDVHIDSLPPPDTMSSSKPGSNLPQQGPGSGSGNGGKDLLSGHESSKVSSTMLCVVSCLHTTKCIDPLLTFFLQVAWLAEHHGCGPSVREADPDTDRYDKGCGM